MFASPVFLVSSLVATLWAGIFHLLFGRRLLDMFLYWFIGLVGFAVGQAMADILGFHWLLVGQVHIVEGTTAAWVGMLVAKWLKV
jgi:hypothetical protein